MADLQRVVVAWSGHTGLPGVSVFHGVAGGTLNSDLKTMFNAIKAGFPNNLSWAIPTGGDTIDDTTGAINGTWSNVGGGGTVGGTASGGYAVGVGFYTNWRTGTIINGRRLMGRTFFTNLTAGMYDTTGNIDNTSLGTFTTAMTAVVTAGQLRIWHRPPPGGGTGSSAAAASASIPDLVTSLRSRRR